MQYNSFVESYAGKTDDELLRLQLDSHDLTEEASLALAAELGKRGLGGAQKLSAFRTQEEMRHEEEDRKPGNLFFTRFLGAGRWYFGKAERVYDAETGRERFKTTIFIIVLCFPLVPVGSYLVVKKKGFFAPKIVILKKLPLNWAQVFRVWLVALSGLVALILFLRMA